MQVNTYMRKTLYMAFFIYINSNLKRFMIQPFSHSPKKVIKVINIDMKKIFFAMIVTSLLIGGACAASVNDFNR